MSASRRLVPSEDLTAINRRNSRGRDRRNRALLEHHLGCGHQSCAPGPRHHLDGDDAVATEGKEVIVGRQLGRRIEAEYVEEDGGDDVLCGSAEFTPVAAAHAEIYCGESSVVEFAVRCHRQCVHPDEHRRHHVGGQRALGPDAQCGIKWLSVGVGLDRRAIVGSKNRSCCGRWVRGATRVGTPIDGDDSSCRHIRMRLHSGGDLTRFDTESADLDLVVDAAQILQLARDVPPRKIAGAVHTGSGPVRVGDESCCGQRRTTAVSETDLRSGHIQFSDDADRRRLQMRGEDVGAEAGQRPPDDRRSCDIAVRRHHGVRDVHRGLGDAVHVDQRRRGRVAIQPWRESGRIQCLAAEYDRSQCEVRVVRPVLFGVDQRIER